MSEEKPENQYDWEKLKAELKEKTPRLGTMTVTMPDREPPRTMTGVTQGIIPIRHVVDPLRTSVLQILKTRKKSGINTSYYYQPYSIPLTPQAENQMTPKDLSAKLGFDTEAMIKPKTTADVSAVLDEAISEMDTLSKMLDEENKNFCRERFCAGEYSFTQYMDKNDNAHIEWIDPEIKKNILDNNLVGVSPWVKIFEIDGSYCRFTNKHSKTVGRLKMKYPSTSPRDTWVFESEPIGGTTWEFVCTKPYPYDCEREVVQWMVKMNLFEAFINYNPK